MTLAYAAYLFDLDGTLIDSIELIVSSFRHAWEHHGGETRHDGTWVSLIGVPLAEAFAQLSSDPEQVAAMVRTYREHDLIEHDRMVRSYPGVPTTLSVLASRGKQLAVVTSKLHADAVRGLRATGLDVFFSTVIGADDVARGKPHPDSVKRAMAELGVGATESVLIGDSPHDLRAGHAAGVATAAALWGPFERSMLARHAPEHWLAHPSALLDI